MGNLIAVIFFIGGAMVVRGLLTPVPHVIYLSVGGFLLVLAIFLFIRELMKI